MQLVPALQLSESQLSSAGFSLSDKIGSIKALRAHSFHYGNPIGLAEAKKFIEDFMDRANGNLFEFFNIIKTYLVTLPKGSGDSISIEQLIGEISEAIEAGKLYYLDPIEATLLWVEEIKKKGGMSTLVAKYESFVNAL